MSSYIFYHFSAIFSQMSIGIYKKTFQKWRPANVIKLDTVSDLYTRSMLVINNY